MKLPAMLVSLAIATGVGCTGGAPASTPDIPATVQAAIEAAAPTASPTPTLDIDATVEARFQATKVAIPTATPIPTPTPTPEPTASLAVKAAIPSATPARASPSTPSPTPRSEEDRIDLSPSAGRSSVRTDARNRVDVTVEVQGRSQCGTLGIIDPYGNVISSLSPVRTEVGVRFRGAFFVAAAGQYTVDPANLKCAGMSSRSSATVTWTVYDR